MILIINLSTKFSTLQEVATYLLEADIGEIKYQHLLGKTC